MDEKLTVREAIKRRKTRNKTVKMAFYYHISGMFVVVLVLSGTAVKICTGMRDKIVASHAYIYEPQADRAGEDGPAYTYGGTYVIPPDGASGQNRAGDSWNGDPEEFTEEDRLFCHLLEILAVVLPFLFLCTGIWAAGSIFYSRKLKEPFHLLNDGIAHIEKGDLDFSLEYPQRDELGDLCRAFETMRQKVLENNIELWDMAEERKKLNASVAHDLRTPITVIRGYSEYLMRNLGKGAVSKESLNEILSYIQNAAGRLEAYADSVHHIHMLESLSLEYSDVDLTRLFAEITSALNIIAQKEDRTVSVVSRLPEERVSLSVVAVFRILENIVQNACYYSRENVFVELAKRDGYLTFTVIDDGDGFSEKSINKAFSPYYKEEGKEDHYGMGLAVCKILSRKHGGDIRLSNDGERGAKVFVKLKVQEI